MGKNTSVKIIMTGDNSSLNKVLDASDKKMKRNTETTKKAEKGNHELGTSFSQVANNVAVFNGQLDPIAGRLSAIGTGLTRFGVAGLALGVTLGAITLAVKNTIAATAEYEQRQLRFNALLSVTGYQARLTAKDLESLAKQIGDETLSSTEEAAKGINALLTFKKIQGDVFKDTIKLARDAEVAFGGDLRSNVVRFGRVLNDPMTNLGALNRIGVTFTDTQKEMIKNFWETGEFAKAQAIMLDELKGKMEGLAKTEANTLFGDLDSFGEALTTVWENIGQTPIMQGLMSTTRAGVQSITAEYKEIAAMHSEQTRNGRKSLELLNNRETSLKLLNRALEKQKAFEKEIADARLRVQNSSDSSFRTADFSKAENQAERNNQEVIAEQAKYDELNKKYIDWINSLEAIKKEQRDRDANATKIANKLEREQLQEHLKKVLADSEKLNQSVLASNETARSKVQRNADNQVAETLAIYKIELSDTEKLKGNTSEVHEKYAARIAAIETGLQLKLAELDRLEADREKAKANRDKRTLSIAASAAKARAKMLSGIRGDESTTSKLTEKYNTRVDKLKQTVFTEKEIEDSGFADREALMTHYMGLLKQHYDDDIENFNDNEESKTAKMLEQAALRTTKQFNLDANANLQSAEKGVSGVEGFFGVNFDEQAEQYEAVETARLEHLARIEELEISSGEKLVRKHAVNAAAKAKTDEMAVANRARAEEDTWNALQTLGASGSKKMFAINKAANIAQATMNTFTAASNALASVAFPFNIAAAALIGAAGFVQVRNIVNQPMPQFHDGIDNVPREGTYLLDKGERVLDSRLNGDLREYMKGGNQDGNGSVINLTIPDTGNYNATERWYEDNEDRILNNIKYAMDRP